MVLTEVQQFLLGRTGSRAKFLVANKTDIPNILLVKLGTIGSLVMASPFFEQLRNHFPHSEIVLVVGRSSYPAVEHNPSINRFIIADDDALDQGGWLRQVVEYFRLIFNLRKEEFDLSFVLQHAWPFRLLSYLVGIPVRVGFGYGREGFLLTHTTFTDWSLNESESYLDLLRRMNIPAVLKKTYYYLNNEEKYFKGLFLERYSISSSEEVVAIAPGGGEIARCTMFNERWPVQNYIELVQRLINERSCRVILVGGPNDRKITGSIIQSCPSCLDATDLSFSEMASILQGCNQFIGNDYARNSIAVAMGVSCIRILGPTDYCQSTSLDIVRGATVAPVKPMSSNAEFPTAVSVDEVWERLTTS